MLGCFLVISAFVTHKRTILLTSQIMISKRLLSTTRAKYLKQTYKHYSQIGPHAVKWLSAQRKFSPLYLFNRQFSITRLLRENSAPPESATTTPSFQGEKPRYQLSFTCKVCKTPSTHNVSKQAYHKGTVLVQCPGCENRHLIADHLKIFSDKRITIEDILASKGTSITKKTIDVSQLADALENREDLEWEEVPKALAEKMEKEDNK